MFLRQKYAKLRYKSLNLNNFSKKGCTTPLPLRNAYEYQVQLISLWLDSLTGRYRLAFGQNHISIALNDRPTHGCDRRQNQRNYKGIDDKFVAAWFVSLRLALYEAGRGS